MLALCVERPKLTGDVSNKKVNFTFSCQFTYFVVLEPHPCLMFLTIARRQHGVAYRVRLLHLQA
eukprot:5971619-Pleurochrysis_carterae.AAC.1